MKKSMLAGIVAVLFTSSPGFAADLGGKVLKIGSDTTSPPMEMVDTATGTIIGFDVDVVSAVCTKINCKAEFVTTGWDGIFAALLQGDFDLVASGVSITDERKKTMDFSDPYLVNSQAILVRVADQGITLDKFKSDGLKLAAQTGTTDADLAQSIVGRDNSALYDTFNSAVQALRAGDVSGVVINGANGAAYEKEFAGELVVGVKDLTTDPLGLVFRKGDPMVAAFNEGLAAIKADGTLDTLIGKYWGIK